MFKEYKKKQLSLKQAIAKKKQGYKIGALHNHSLHSQDVPHVQKNEPNRIISRAKKQGADYVAITDHDTDKAYDSLQNAKHVIRSAEIEVHDKQIGHPIHFGMYNIKDRAFFEKLMSIAKKRNAYKLVSTALTGNTTVVANHPWWAPRGYFVKPLRVWQLIETFGLPVELNEKRSYIENISTLMYAAKRGLPVVAGSDTHIGDPFPSCTVAKGNTKEAFLKNIQNGKTYIVSKSATLFHQPRMMATYMHDVVSSKSLKKELRSNVKSVDKIIKILSIGTPNKTIASHIIAAGAFVAGTVYVPSAHIYSLYKLLKDQVQRTLTTLPEIEKWSMPDSSGY